jgi:hypothetical protein
MWHSHFWLCAGFSLREGRGKEGESGDKENRRNAGEYLVQKILA